MCQKEVIKKISEATEKYQQTANYIFYQMAFNEKELYVMFQDFYMSFIEKFEIGPSELASIFEIMCGEGFLGKDTITSKILPVIGVQ